ncbi:MAG: histidine phosphatase family protein [Micromonosporaceae bacterium]
MTRLIIWRHGQTGWNQQNRFQGQTDVALDAVGSSQANAAAELLAAERPTRLISSDLRRAADTAAALAAITDLPVHADSRLRERHYGEWEGLTRREITKQWPEQYRRWRAGESIPECGVESPEEVAKRVGDGLLDAVDQVAEGGLVVVVSHGGAARHGIGILMDWPAQVVRSLGPLGNCHWSELRQQPRGWELTRHNVGLLSGAGIRSESGWAPNAKVDSDAAGTQGGAAPSEGS